MLEMLGLDLNMDFFLLLNTFVDQKIFRGKAPWTINHEKR